MCRHHFPSRHLKQMCYCRMRRLDRQGEALASKGVGCAEKLIELADVGTHVSEKEEHTSMVAWEIEDVDEACFSGV